MDDHSGDEASKDGCGSRAVVSSLSYTLSDRHSKFNAAPLSSEEPLRARWHYARDMTSHLKAFDGIGICTSRATLGFAICLIAALASVAKLLNLLASSLVCLLVVKKLFGLDCNWLAISSS